jgi:hypothetical protein
VGFFWLPLFVRLLFDYDRYSYSRIYARWSISELKKKKKKKKLPSKEESGWALSRRG